LVKILPGTSGKEEEPLFVLGKTGWFLLEDEMTKVNFNFVNDVCYKGAFEFKRSIYRKSLRYTQTTARRSRKKQSRRRRFR